jgi:hypothetical protein
MVGNQIELYLLGGSRQDLGGVAGADPVGDADGADDPTT